jgi:hypothetical protein
VASSDVLREQLREVEGELAGLDDRRSALEQAAADLRAAISSFEQLEATGTPPARTRRTKSKPAQKRPTVTEEDLVEALRGLGGTATVEQLVDALELPDGRSLNGARRIAVGAGSVTYEDRTYTLTS